MTNGKFLWFVAVVLTIGSLVYQRMTGPTYPLRGRVTLGGQEIALKLRRSHELDAANPARSDQPVQVVVADTAVHATMQWRRFPTNDPWTDVELTRHGDTLSAVLPAQVRAGKLAYQLRLTRGGERAIFPAEPAVTRFKGAISAAIIIPHLLCMFGGLMLLMRAGVGAVANEPSFPKLAKIGVLVFGLGGFVFGPWMQHQAFGPWWAGFPFGTDMTDNKTAAAMLSWLVALWLMRGGKPARRAVIVATLVTLAAFIIPHSVFGSQVDWSQQPPR